MNDIHFFSVSVAEEYGLECAIILNQLSGWISHNKANNTNYHEGRYWTFNSIRAWKELLPYSTEKKIRMALEKLEKEGLIISGNFNKTAYDRTKWYALTEKGESILPKRQMPKRQMEEPKRKNENNSKGKPIPENNTTKENTKKIASPTEMCGAEAPLYSDPLVNLDESRIF